MQWSGCRHHDSPILAILGEGGDCSRRDNGVLGRIHDGGTFVGLQVAQPVNSEQIGHPNEAKGEGNCFFLSLSSLPRFDALNHVVNRHDRSCRHRPLFSTLFSPRPRSFSLHRLIHSDRQGWLQDPLPHAQD
jgi:hypothetical protein